MQEHFAQTHALYPDSIQQTQDTQSQASKNDIKKRTHKKVENSAHETVVQRASLQSPICCQKSPNTHTDKGKTLIFQTQHFCPDLIYIHMKASL